jgi:hypothetical protein
MLFALRFLHAVRQRLAYSAARAENAHHFQGPEDGLRQLRRDIVRQTEQPNDPAVQLLASGAIFLQFTGAVDQSAHHHGFTRHSLAYFLAVHAQLVADGRTDEIRAAGIKTFIRQQIDLPQVHHTHIDRDFLGISHRSAPKYANFSLSYTQLCPFVCIIQSLATSED